MIAAVHVTVNAPIDWTQILAQILPIVVAFIIALTAYLRTKTNEKANAIQSQRVDDLKARVAQHDSMLDRVNQSVTSLEGKGGPST